MRQESTVIIEHGQVSESKAKLQVPIKTTADGKAQLPVTTNNHGQVRDRKAELMLTMDK